MTVREVVECMSGPDRIKIVDEEGTELFRGYQGMLQILTGKEMEYQGENVNMSSEVVKIGLFVEIFSKENREAILASTEGRVPVPDMITDIPYREIEECIYIKIVTKK